MRARLKQPSRGFAVPRHGLSAQNAFRSGAGVGVDTSRQIGCCTATLVAVEEPLKNQRLTKSPALYSAVKFLNGNLLETKSGG